jgi:hypothetical protein
MFAAAEGQNAWNPQHVETAAINNWMSRLDDSSAAARARRKQELAQMLVSNVTVVVSKAEQELIRRYCTDCVVTIVSNIHDSMQLPHPRCDPRSGVLFVGSMAHVPNQQAIKHLLQDVLPHILQQIPKHMGARFKVHIVGGTKVVPTYIQDLFTVNAAHIVYHGWLSDDMLALLYTRVKLVVAPLLSGAGVKGKVSCKWQY